MKNLILSREKSIAVIFYLAVVILIGLPGGASAQTCKNAIVKERLIQYLRSKATSADQIAGGVRKCGVDFQLTSEVESELIAAGARPEVISAVRDSYRQPARSNDNTASSKSSSGASSRTTAAPKKISGEPLAKDAIVALLENGVADAQVRKNVEARGVSFKPNAQINNEIKQAGGSVALVNLIAASYVDVRASSGATSNNAYGTTGNKSSASDDYESLIDRAVSQYDVSKDAAGAIGSLQQAMKLEPNNARAYQLLGFTYLYGQQNFVEAEKYMREAVTRGGSAVFRVFHDHDGLFNETCQGSLFIAKDVVRFESDNNVHTFQTDDVNIKEVKTNSAFRRAFQTKTGSFKIVLKTGNEKDSVKFGFAPLTDNIAESKMIIRIIGKN